MAGRRVALGIDQGSSGAKAVVMASDGEVLGTGRVRCSDMRHTSSGTQHDPSAWLAESVSAARSALQQAAVPAVDVIGLGALGPAPVVLDADLRPLAPSSVFPADPFSTLEALPEATTARAAWVVDVAGFLVASLVGRAVMDRITAADYPAGHAPIGVRTPEACQPFEAVGELTPDAAEGLGLSPGVPVTAGTYDTFVDLAGIEVSEPGSAAILLGSTVIVGTVRTEPDVPDGLRASPHVGPGWFVGGWTSTAGRALDWAASLAGAADRNRVVNEASAMAPGGGGVLVWPYLDGERAPVWDPAARGVMMGLTTGTTLAHIYRGVLDGVVLSTVDLAERLAPLRAGAPWTVAGGGVRDPSWTTATADALGEPIGVVDLPDGGAAARAGFAALGERPPPVEPRIVEPDATQRGRWQELAGVFRGMHEATADRMHRLGSLANEDSHP